MMGKILICDPISKEGIQKLREAGLKVDINAGISADELRSLILEYDAIIVRSRTKVTKEIIELGKKLKAICRAGSGLDNIDVKSAEERNIAVLNTPEAPAASVAELTFGLIISLARNIPKACVSMKKGEWMKKKLKGWQLEGKTLGLIGLGNVGRKVAAIARGFGMKVLVTKRTPPSRELIEEFDVEFVPLEELLERSDIVSLHIPLTEQTSKMIGERELNLMKRGAFLINTSRGAIVDEEALFRALQIGKLGGAALDVYQYEPPTDLRIIRLDNVICTPHIGAQTVEAQRDASVLIAEKLINYLRNRSL